jgi:hypothetical protein
MFMGWVMRHMVAVHDIVVPVSLTRLEDGILEAERSNPGARALGRIPREWKLTMISVPRTDEVDSLDISSGSKTKT